MPGHIRLRKGRPGCAVRIVLRRSTRHIFRISPDLLRRMRAEGPADMGDPAAKFIQCPAVYIGDTENVKRIVVPVGRLLITWKKQSGVTGYQIRYKTGSTTKTVKVKKASTTKKTISKLKKGKTYTITLRSYKTKNGTTTYSAWSKKKKVKVKT